MSHPSPAAAHDGGHPVPAPSSSLWEHPEALTVASAPVPAYGVGSLADLLPTLAAGMEVPGTTALIP